MVYAKAGVLLCSAYAALALPALNARQDSDCADVTVIFARGTFEPPLIGIIVGPPFNNSLTTQLSPKTLSFQGVPYPADIAGFLEGGDPQGSQTIADMVTNTTSQCPDTDIVMSGYSQGAQLVHNAAALIIPDTAERVQAVVMFGDPKDNQTLANGLSSRSITFCNEADNICDGGDLILPPHLTYGEDADAAAAFVVSHTQ